MVQMTDTTCIDCGRHFGLGTPLFLAAIRYSVTKGNEADVFNDDNTELKYEPVFFDQTCWTEIRDGLLGVVADKRPVENDDAIFDCEYCGSGILPLEVYCRIRAGELRMSPRSPKRQALYQFFETGHRNWVMCLSCMAYVYEEVLEIWADVTQGDECSDCQHIRCWREDVCPLECGCHRLYGDEEDEEEETFSEGDVVAYTREYVERVRVAYPTYTLPSRGVVAVDEDDEGLVLVTWIDGSYSAARSQDLDLVE